MTNTERGFLRKMVNDNVVSFKEKDSGWIHVDCGKEFNSDRIALLNNAGIGYVKGNRDVPIIYLMDDYSCDYGRTIDNINGIIFTARRDVVCSVPVSAHLVNFAVKSSVIDLSEFCGVISDKQFCADKIIVGEDCRTWRAHAAGAYIQNLLASREYCNWCSHSNVSCVKIVGDIPIMNMYKFCAYNSELKELDLSEADLTKCSKFSKMCMYTAKLTSVQMGDLCANAFVREAFLGSAFVEWGHYFANAKEMKDYIDIKDMKSRVFGG